MLPVGRPPTSSQRIRRSSSMRDRSERTSAAMGGVFRLGAGVAASVANATKSARTVRDFGNRMDSSSGWSRGLYGKRRAPLCSRRGGQTLSIEGGIPGNQQRLVCPNCGKVFFAWRPDDLPGQKVKCYFCKHEFADEAALRPVPVPMPAATPPAEGPPAETAPADQPPEAAS